MRRIRKKSLPFFFASVNILFKLSLKYIVLTSILNTRLEEQLVKKTLHNLKAIIGIFILNSFVPTKLFDSILKTLQYY